MTGTAGSAARQREQGRVSLVLVLTLELIELLISLDGLTRPSARAPTLRGVSAMGSPALAPGKQREARETD